VLAGLELLSPLQPILLHRLENRGPLWYPRAHEPIGQVHLPARSGAFAQVVLRIAASADASIRQLQSGRQAPLHRWGLELRLRSAVANTGGLSVSDGRQEQAFTPDGRFCLLNAVQHSPRHPLHACERRRATGCGGELY
jgi:hypothetical protein